MDPFKNMSARMAVMSHLSDAQQLIEYGIKSEADQRINFAKFIILKTKGDLNQEIDADALWTEFNEGNY